MVFNIQKVGHAFSLFRIAYKGYSFKIAVVTILGFISGLASSIGISMLIPLFSLVVGQSTSSDINNLTKAIEEVFAFLHLGFSLPVILILVVVLFVAKALVNLLTNYINARTSERYLEDMRGLSLRKTMAADWSYLMNQKIGYLDGSILGDAAGGATILKNISEAILGFTSLATYTFVALNISVWITIVSLLSGILIFISLKPYFYKIRKLSRFVNIANKEASHHINESLIGIKTIKAYAAESPIISRGYSRFDELRKAQVKTFFMSGLQSVFFEPASLAFISIIFIFSYKNPDFSMVSFAVVIYLVKNMFSFIQAIQSKFNSINSALPYLEKMLDYQKEAGQHKETSSGNKPFKFEKALEIKEVSFSYPETDRAVLTNIDFPIQKGEMVGIIGPSGVGKTTLVDILLRLLKPQKGKVLIDDVDIDSIDLNSWHKNIGYVSQDIFLINDTLEANISFYNDSIKKEDIITAAKMANIYDFIQELPKKFDTIVGERGVKLSGGQKQRICLARALSRKPGVLILDEATSSLDNESEALIQKSISDLKGKITVIIIAHRLSTIMNSDKIIVLDGGRVSEIGAPEKLITEPGSYLFKNQRAQETQL